MDIEAINAERYTLMQLKAWCIATGLNASGAKASLAARLSELSAEMRGQCPGTMEPGTNTGGAGVSTRSSSSNGSQNDNGANVGSGADENADGENYANDDADGEDNGNGADGAPNDNGQEGNGNDGRMHDNATLIDNGSGDQQNESISHVRNGAFGIQVATNGTEVQEVQHEPIIDSVSTVHSSDSETLKLKILEKEIELLKLQLNLEKEKCTMTTTANHSVVPGVPLETLKELITDYDGCEGFDMWRSQLFHFQAALNVSNEVLGVVLRLKLKGAALTWYNSNKMFAKSTPEIIDEMAVVFANKENTLDARRKFEKRLWKVGETFLNYVSEKRLLGNALSLSDREFVEYIIDGIPDWQLQVHAKILNCKTANDLVASFRTVELRQRKLQVTERTKCYNCNCLGHLSKECQKPKRDLGTCFTCGERGHFAASCKNKKPSKNNFSA